MESIKILYYGAFRGLNFKIFPREHLEFKPNFWKHLSKAELKLLLLIKTAHPPLGRVNLFPPLKINPSTSFHSISTPHSHTSHCESSISTVPPHCPGQLHRGVRMNISCHIVTRACHSSSPCVCVRVRCVSVRGCVSASVGVCLSVRSCSCLSVKTTTCSKLTSSISVKYFRKLWQFRCAGPNDGWNLQWRIWRKHQDPIKNYRIRTR